MLKALIIGVSLFSVTAAVAQTDPAPAASSTAMQVTDPQDFADMAASSNMFEIESSKLALEKSSNADVLSFAQHMIDDHGKASDQMMAAAETDGITPATTMQAADQDMLDNLSGMEGEAFDQAYTSAQMDAHDKAIALFDGFGTNGQESALKSFAAATEPTLQSHHDELAAMAE
ncbi:DUF4142 domain-containing protein [uncultured Devosia sp.]|uniref:DUF4142 domain-containing protein n=1 Tax=uncultured Devosia sp. TaxID=211434 RepID=UPI0035CA6663